MMPAKPHTAGAVFISYASQDSSAAIRICETLRSAGIEVWIDQSELRGGDAWDLTIRKQVHECSLFIPLISTNTNNRTEGYFRREWNLATRRLLDMAHDAPFLVPVVIDETREINARVPEEFLNAQWTRLPNGETPAAFAQHVHELLKRNCSNEYPYQSTEALGSAPPNPRLALTPGRAPRVLGVSSILIALLLAVSGGLYWYFQQTADLPAQRPEATPAFTTHVTTPYEKSIAVLPFADMSANRDQEYISDGIAEEILIALSQVPNLKVIARTSSFSFKDQNLDVAEIARRLNVAHVLEGSVRSSENKLRISAQLVDATDNTQIWSERYDRTFDDIFEVQDEISRAIAEALKVKLVAEVETQWRGGTTDVAAYQSFLRAGNALNEGTKESLESAAKHLVTALEHDAEFGRAWSRLAMVSHYKNLYGFQSTQDTYQDLREYTSKALAISPNIAEAHALQLVIFAAFEFNWKAAESAGQRALELEPNDPFTLENLALTYSIFGDHPKAIRFMQMALDRDPSNLSRVDLLADIYYHSGRFEDAENALRSLLATQPNRQWVRTYISRALLAQGKTKAALAMLELEPDEGARHAYMPIILQAVGRRTDADKALQAQIDHWATECASCVARTFAYRGEKDQTFEWLERAYRQKDTALTNILDEPLYAKVSDDPRFKAFVRERLKVER